MQERDRLSFTAAWDKLNAKFESYKLRPQHADSSVCRHRLVRPLAITHAPDHVPLSFAETQSRAEHNHLSAGMASHLAYVDRDLRFMAIEVKNASEVKVHELVQLPPSRPSSSALAADYPVAKPLTPSQWCLSDGVSSLYVVDVRHNEAGWRGVIRSRCTVATLQEPIVASVRLCSASVDPQSGIVSAIVSIPRKRSSGSGQINRSSAAVHSSTFFEISCLLFASSPQAADLPVEIQTLWTMYSDSVPFQSVSDSVGKRMLFCGTHPVTLRHDSLAPAAPSSDYDYRSESEIPTTRTTTGQNSDRQCEQSPPAFSWTQDSDSLSLAFPIPSDTPTSSIRVVFSRHHLSVHVATPKEQVQDVHSHRQTRVSHKQLWAEIDPHTSIWTFDREAEGRGSTYGLLVLHLEKEHAGTRWTCVFQPTSQLQQASNEHGDGAKICELTEAEQQAELETIPETLDPSELAAIVERMEQWTQAATVGQMDAQQQPEIKSSLLGDEIDAEVDSDAGRSFVVTWVESAWTREPRVATPHSSVPFSAISLPLDMTSPDRSDESADASIVIKHDVDGLLFTPPLEAPASYSWSHAATFPALAFVLASKRDCTFVRHVGDTAVIALDSPPHSDPGVQPRYSSSTNAFVYYRPGERDARTAMQAVIKVGGANSGAVLGVAGVSSSARPGRDVLVCVLCENELVVFPLDENK
ncbi:hypothetical protein ACM66B_003135 [Microbotryomycetes sp. NB124-2]